MDACTAQSVLALLSLTHISSEHSTKVLLADLSHWQTVSTAYSNVRGPSLCSATPLPQPCIGRHVACCKIYANRTQ